MGQLRWPGEVQVFSLVRRRTSKEGARWRRLPHLTEGNMPETSHLSQRKAAGDGMGNCRSVSNRPPLPWLYEAL